MDRKVTTAYTVFSVLVLIALSSWVAYSFFQTTANNTIAAASTFDAVKTSIGSAVGSKERLDTPALRRYVRSLFLQDPQVEVLSVSTLPGDVLYLLARHATSVVAPGSDQGHFTGSIRYKKTTQKLFSSPISGPPEANRYRITAVFTILSRGDLYMIARTLLIALVAFLILTSIMIVIMPYLAPRPAESPAPEGLDSQGLKPEPAHPEAAEPADAPTAEATGTSEEQPTEELTTEPAPELEPEPEPVPHPEPKPQPVESGHPPSPAPQAPPPPVDGEPEQLDDLVEAVELPSESGPTPPTEPSPQAPPEEPLRAASPAGDELPPEVELPSLHEVLGEDPTTAGPVSELTLFDRIDSELYGAPEAAEPPPSTPAEEPAVAAEAAEEDLVEVTEVEEPQPEAPSYRLATDELADIPDFEDLETLDGHAPADSAPEPAHRSAAPSAWPSGPPESVEPQPAVPEEPVEAEPYFEDAPDIEELELAELPEQLPPLQPAPTDGASRPEPTTATPQGHGRELFNPDSGLAWQDHLEQRLSFELDRAASFDQDLSISLIRFDKTPDTRSRLAYAREIRSYFPFHDLCFDFGNDGFVVVLPNTDIDQSIRSMENFLNKLHEENPASPRVFIGTSARNGRLLGGERLLTEARSAEERARTDRQNAIYALRVDPGKYREYIKSTLS